MKIHNVMRIFSSAYHFMMEFVTGASIEEGPYQIMHGKLYTIIHHLN